MQKGLFANSSRADMILPNPQDPTGIKPSATNSSPGISVSAVTALSPQAAAKNEKEKDEAEEFALPSTKQSTCTTPVNQTPSPVGMTAAKLTPRAPPSKISACLSAQPEAPAALSAISASSCAAWAQSVRVVADHSVNSFVTLNIVNTDSDNCHMRVIAMIVLLRDILCAVRWPKIKMNCVSVHEQVRVPKTLKLETLLEAYSHKHRQRLRCKDAHGSTHAQTEEMLRTACLFLLLSQFLYPALCSFTVKQPSCATMSRFKAKIAPNLWIFATATPLSQYPSPKTSPPPLRAFLSHLHA